MNLAEKLPLGKCPENYCDHIDEYHKIQKQEKEDLKKELVKVLKKSHKLDEKKGNK